METSTTPAVMYGTICWALTSHKSRLKRWMSRSQAHDN